MLKRFAAPCALLAMALPAVGAAAPVVFSAGGTNDPTSIQGVVDNFRTALGDPNNANLPGQTSGRREINWDGGGSALNAPGSTPFNVFLNSRGGQFTTPGSGFVQAPASAAGAGEDLGTFFGNPTYDSTFGAFSPLRLFVPVGSNVTDALFFVPGTGGTRSATVSGFGAVFSDVDMAGVTSIAFFDVLGDLLIQQFVPAASVADQGLSFLGVVFNAGERVARVRITTGNAALSAGTNDGPGVDLVAMDDFLYSEPLPEPAPWALFGAAAMGLATVVRRRRVKPLPV